MAGTKEGGRKAAETNKARHGEDFYKELGRIGGMNGHTGGFASGDNASKFGKLGGKRSRRGRAIKIGGQLTLSESELLSKHASRLIKGLVEDEEITADEQEALINEANRLIIANKWPELFVSWTGRDDIANLWFTVIGGSVMFYHDMLSKDELSELDSLEYGRVKTLCEAYYVTTGRRINVTTIRKFLS